MIAGKLNGHINLIQNHVVRPDQFIASKLLLTHQVSLNPPDDIFLKNNATNILTYWFVDCVYYGVSSNYSFNYKYDKPDSEHLVEALVVAGFEPITTPAPPTTTTTTTKPTTSTTTVTTTTVTTTTVKPRAEEVNFIPVHESSKHRRKREVNITVASKPAEKNSNSARIGVNMSFPYVCQSKVEVTPDPKKVYGYFSRKMIVKGEF